MIDMAKVKTKARKQRARAEFFARHPKARRYTHDASDRDELGPELVQVAEPLRPCIGCGAELVRGRHYCRGCKAVLSHGGNLEARDLPTTADFVRIGVLRPSSLVGGGR